MKCITTHKKVREIGGALGKNDIFSYYVPILSPIFPHNLGTPSLWNLCFWIKQNLGNLQLKRNWQVCYELKIYDEF